ncbi:hypothetical protein STEG23_037659 [Scotinomys teguina]
MDEALIILAAEFILCGSDNLELDVRLLDIKFCLYPQHQSASLSLSFLHHVFVHHNGIYLSGTLWYQWSLWMSSANPDCEHPESLQLTAGKAGDSSL